MRTPTDGSRRGPWRRRLAVRVAPMLLVAALAAAACSTAADAPSATDAPPAGLSDVLADLGVDEIPTDYALLVDTSSSMQQDGRYDRVQEVLRAFLGSLRPIDRVTLITFDVAPSPIYAGPATQAAAALDRMPATPTGGFSDIGAAIATAVDQLIQPGGAPVGAVVLLTDGEHNPPVGSIYPDAQAPAWRALAQRAQQLPGDRLRGYAFPLTGEVSGAQLLTMVLPRTEVPRVSPQELGSLLNLVPEHFRRSNAAARTAPDLTGQVDVRWLGSDPGLDLSGEDILIPLELSTSTSVLPVHVVDARVLVSGFPGTVTGLPDRISLLPGRPQQVSLRLHPDVDSGFHFGRTTTALDGSIRFTGRLDSPWRPVIERDFAQSLDLRPVDATIPLRGTVSSGLSWLVVGAILIGLLLAVLLGGWIWRRRHPLLVGELLAYPPDSAPIRVVLAAQRVVRSRSGPGRRLAALGGDCVLRGQPSVGAGTPPDLVISYLPRDGRARIVRVCSPGESREIHGVRFCYLARSWDIPPDFEWDTSLPNDSSSTTTPPSPA